MGRRFEIPRPVRGPRGQSPLRKISPLLPTFSGSGKWNRWRSDRVDELEAALREFTGAAHVVALASGTAGLEVALKAAGVRPGDEVILPAYTYVATATAVLQVGGVPVFADIIPETENIDPPR